MMVMIHVLVVVMIHVVVMMKMIKYENWIVYFSALAESFEL